MITTLCSLAGLSCDLMAELKTYQPESEHLIGAWIGHHPGVTEACVTCAEQKCASENLVCSGDASCRDFTRCVGATPTPAGQIACRAKFNTWLTQDKVAQRAWLGPYGHCVFSERCVDECVQASDTWCIGKYTLPRPTTATVSLTLALVDEFMPWPVLPDLKVRACRADDIACTSDSTISTVTDQSGIALLELPIAPGASGFDGYLEITGGDRYPTLLALGSPISEATSITLDLAAKMSVFGTLDELGVARNNTRGMTQIRFLGCAGSGVAGVSFSAWPTDREQKPWYMSKGHAHRDADSTDPVGVGGILDVRDGLLEINATHADGDRGAPRLALGTARVPIRAEFMTIALLVPSHTVYWLQ